MVVDNEIKSFLKDISSIYKETSGGKEIQIFCPYCGDAFRKKNPRWGHLYISTETGMFYCHRCNEKGTLLRLLLDLEYKNEDKLNELAKFYSLVNTKISSDRNSTIIRNNISNVNIDTFKEEILKNINDKVLEYLKYRADIDTIDDLLYYRIKPFGEILQFYDHNYTILLFEKTIGKKGYIRKTGGFYILPKYNRLYIIAEGIFDIINIDKYLPYDIYTKVTSCGKNYITVLKKICKYNNVNDIKIFIDNDIDKYKFEKFLYNYVRRNSIDIDNLEVIENKYGKDFGDEIIFWSK